MDRYIRQVPMLGQVVQERICRLLMAIVGVSGIGSQFSLLSALLGVQNFLLIDPASAIEEKHGNRFAFGVDEFLGRPKVEAACEFLRRWGKRIVCTALQKDVRDPEARRLLEKADVIAACTDSEDADTAISSIGAILRKPVLLMKQGAAIDGPGRIRHAGALAAIQLPGKTCLAHICLPEVAEPSAVSVATSGFSAAVMGWLLLLNLLRGEKNAPNFMMFDALQGEMRSYRVARHPGCGVCEG